MDIYVFLRGVKNTGGVKTLEGVNVALGIKSSDTHAIPFNIYTCLSQD